MRTPESLLEPLDVADAAVVLLSTFGGTTIVAVASLVALAAVLAKLVSSGGKGEATIEVRPFCTSEVVNVLAISVEVALEDIAVAEVIVLTSIEVSPCAILSVIVVEVAASLVVSEVSVAVVAVDVFKGIEVRPPATIISVVVCATLEFVLV